MRVAGVVIPNPPYRLGHLSVLDLPTPKNEKQAIAMLNYLSSGEEPQFASLLTGYTAADRCLGSDARSCVLLLRTKLSFKTSDFSRRFLSFQELDVSGVPVSKIRDIRLTASSTLDSSTRYIFVTLHLDRNNVVTNMSFGLPGDPGNANTEREYDQTHVYEAASLAIGTRCDGMANKIGFYRFFQNFVKPTRDAPKRDTYVGVTEASDEYGTNSKNISLCGSSIRYNSRWGSATWQIDAGNPLGKFTSASVAFSVD
jgi:hypothetical protein